MDIKQLRYFIAVYEAGSIAKAANKVFISQQGLSMALLRLESELSCTLLERTQDGVTLTPEGERLLPHAQKLVAEFNELESYFKGPSPYRTTVKLACALGAIPEFLASILFNFQKSYPQYLTHIDEVNDMDCDTLVEKKTAELGFGLAPLNQALFSVRPLFSSPFCLLVNRNDPLAELDSVSLDILQSTPVFIMNERSKTNLVVSRCCQSKGFLPNFRYLAAEVIAIHRMVGANVGRGISVLSIAQDMPHPNVVAIPFEEPEMMWELNLFKLKNRPLSPAARAFEQYVIQNTSQHSKAARQFG